MAHRAATTVAECSLTGCVWARFRDNITSDKSQHRKLTLEKKILLQLLPGIQIAIFPSPDWRSGHETAVNKNPYFLSCIWILLSAGQSRFSKKLADADHCRFVELSIHPGKAMFVVHIGAVSLQNDKWYTEREDDKKQANKKGKENQNKSGIPTAPWAYINYSHDHPFLMRICIWEKKKKSCAFFSV